MIRSWVRPDIIKLWLCRSSLGFIGQNSALPNSSDNFHDLREESIYYAEGIVSDSPSVFPTYLEPIGVLVRALRRVAYFPVYS